MKPLFSIPIASLLLTGTLTTVAMAADAPVPYRFVLLTQAHGEIAAPRGLNHVGDVVGESFSKHHGESKVRAKIWSAGGATFLKSVGEKHQFEFANGVNDHGVAVGQGSVNGRVSSPVMWVSGQASLLAGVWGAGYPPGEALGINNAGQIVGYIYPPPHTVFDQGSGPRPVLWNNPFSPRDLTPDNAKCGVATAINQSGVVAGWTCRDENWRHTAVIWQDGVATELGTLGGKSSEANAISNNNTVVGYAWVSDIPITTQAFIWKDGVINALPGPLNTQAFGVNDRGDAVGSGPGAAYAVGWISGKYLRLDDLLSAEVKAEGWRLAGASAINEAGVIVGTAINDASFKQAGYALVPPGVTFDARVEDPID